jgi:hypothetical protein
MPDFESLCRQLLAQRGLRRRLVLGGLLGMVPVFNLLLAGWTLRYLRQLRAREGLAPPDFGRDFSWWRGLARESLPACAILLPLALLTIGSGAVMAAVSAAFLEWIGLSLFASTVAWVPLSLGCFVFLGTAWAALWHYLECGERLGRLFPLENILRLALGTLDRWLYPALAGAGLMALGWPLYGFAAMLLCLCLTPWMAGLFLQLKNSGD